ncbi:hypothetical protein CR162_17120 [Pseudoroseomonas rhizosphaerae]|uniref:Uncharacterized protein n=1 Tax=Teichococcus rhizosphaerae TaxID=1335062 RepID=A0A2C7A6U4_9PROT|nr:hypothetical protein [Pseudoroseomonas rhizosphaerae]PHK93709.1 hypothetical protein CR162_17120 [Pseudoroseomonas rhizosphaerae]
MRRSLLLASLVLPPLLAQPAVAQMPPPPPAMPAAVPGAAPGAMPDAAPDAAPGVRVRSGQHPDRGRVVLHLGSIPPHSLRRVGQDHEIRLRGLHRLDISALRRLREVKGAEVRQEAGETVLLLRAACDCVAESGVVEGMLFVDLRPASSAPPPAPAPAPAQVPAAAREAGQLAAARRRLLDDAVRLGLMNPGQAEAMLRGAPAVAALPFPPASPAPVSPAQASPAPASPPAPALSARPPADDLVSLRESMLGRLALLNGPPAAPAPSASTPSASTPPRMGGSAPLPNPSFAAPAGTPPRPACLEPAFSLRDWAGEAGFVEQLAARRGALALADHGAAETAALAELYAFHELNREALAVLSAPLLEQPGGALRERLERVRDVARLLGREPISPASPLLAEAAECARPDLPLWRALVAAVGGDAAALARLAPQARAALRDVPPDLRLAFAVIMAEAAEEDAETLRTLLAAIRTAPEEQRPDQQARRGLLMARMARLEGNRAEEALHLERAARAGRSVPALQARMRLAALSLSRPGAEGQRAEAQLMDFARAYRFDPLGEEAAILYAQHLLERGELAAALAVAEGASQTNRRSGMESRGARLAAQALRLLLVDAQGLELPPAGERLALYWQYEGYATPGERGDDIRQGALRLMLEEGLADAALDVSRQLTPASAGRPEAALLVARAEAMAPQGDPQRAMALLRALPESPGTRRAAAMALGRMGRPLEAAQALEALQALPDRLARTAWLFQAQAWPGAADAYAELLRDPALDADRRAEATARLASAAALAGQRPGVAPELLAPEAGAAALLQLSGDTAGAARGVAAARSAIARSRQIEGLLPETARN